MFKAIFAVLHRARALLLRLEETPENASMVKDIEDVLTTLEETPLCLGDAYVFVDPRAPAASAFWSNIDGWGSVEAATLFASNEEINPPFVSHTEQAEPLPVVKLHEFFEAKLRQGQLDFGSGYGRAA